MTGVAAFAFPVLADAQTDINQDPAAKKTFYTNFTSNRVAKSSVTTAQHLSDGSVVISQTVNAPIGYGGGIKPLKFDLIAKDDNKDGFLSLSELKRLKFTDPDGVMSFDDFTTGSAIVDNLDIIGVKRTDSAIAAEFLGATQNIVQLGEMSPKFKPIVENMPGGGHHIALTNFSEKYDLDLDKNNQIIVIKHTKWDASREEKTEEFKAYGGDMAKFNAAKKVLSDKLGMK